MRLLIDESLSARVAEFARVAGHDALHVVDLDLLGALDEQIMAVAQRDDRVVVTTDTDFGELLSLGTHPGPSVVLLRRAPHRPEHQAELLVAALPEVADDLAAGAVVVVTIGRVRIRRLPIDPGNSRAEVDE